MSLLDINNNLTPEPQIITPENLIRLSKNAGPDSKIMPIGVFCDNSLRKIFQNCKARVIDLSLLESKIPVSDFTQAFENCQNLEIIRFPDPRLFRYGNELNFTNLCQGDIRLKRITGIRFPLGQVFDSIIFDNMCRGCKKLGQIIIPKFRVRSQLSCRRMLYGCESLRKVKINFKPATLYYYKNLSLDTTLMCHGASSLNYFDMISFWEYIFFGLGPIYGMFEKCTSLQILGNNADEIIPHDSRIRNYEEILEAFRGCDPGLIKKLEHIINRNKIQ